MRASVETPSFFLFFHDDIHRNLDEKNGGVHVFLAVRTWNLWWYSYKPGNFWWCWTPCTRLGPEGCKASNSTKLTQKLMWNRHFSSNIHWNRQEKKTKGFLLKPHSRPPLSPPPFPLEDSSMDSHDSGQNHLQGRNLVTSQISKTVYRFSTQII